MRRSWPVLGRSAKGRKNNYETLRYAISSILLQLFPLKPKRLLQHHILEIHYLIHNHRPVEHFIWWGHFCKICLHVGKIKFNTKRMPKYHDTNIFACVSRFAGKLVEFFRRSFWAFPLNLEDVCSFQMSPQLTSSPRTMSDQVCTSTLLLMQETNLTSVKANYITTYVIIVLFKYHTTRQNFQTELQQVLSECTLLVASFAFNLDISSPS